MTAAVVHQDLICVACASAAFFDLEIWQVNYKSAFLNSHIDVEINVYEPPGFKEKGKKHLVYCLNKAIYGMKQGTNVWWGKRDTAYKSMGWTCFYSE